MPETDLKKFLDKIVVNVGVGRMSQQPNFEDKTLRQVIADIAQITGQKPQTRPAKKSIAGFKIREGQTVGVRVTLRRRKMVDFFERLINIVLPRVRDFGGISVSSVDEGGVLSVGIKEHLVFPEINPDETPLSFSLEAVIVPKIKDRGMAVEVYKKAGVPFKKK